MPQSRLVRVFISSTFRDFMGERDELVKKVFPELRSRCKSRFVELLEVDLRWGITEEQSKKGDTLRICLEEIDKCRPSEPVFFIGLLGERYGWIPEKDFYPESVLEDENLGWVKEHIGGKSVTELEILHGVLRNPAMETRAFFYFRNSGYEQRHWDEIKAAYPDPDLDLKQADFTNEREADSADAERKQEELKEAISESALQYAPQDYENPVDLAELVKNDIWRQIDTLFPADEVPDELERQRMDHQVFCQSRTQAYVKREGLYDALDTHARAEGPEMRVVTGHSGSGKSALLSAWLDRQGEQVVFYHFVGATPQSTSAEGILRRLHATLRQRGTLRTDDRFPAGEEGMAEAVPVWLEKLAAQGGGVILLDAVNQLADARDRELWWWPCQWPEEVRVVFSSLPGDVWREMERRGWMGEGKLVTVPPLRKEERKEIMGRYLKRFSRELDPKLQKKILAATQCANPLFLRTMLDELRLRSRHEELGKNIDRMLECEDEAALFVLVLMNLERDFSPEEHPHLVHEGLGLMGMARRGLTERELLELLSPAEEPVSDPIPQHYWAPLYLALEDALVSREGQLSFFHDYLRQAVWREYLDEEHEEETAHWLLAEPAVRWQENAYGATVRGYGFEHGIYHLLEMGRHGEAAAMLLDRGYQNACVRSHRKPRLVARDLQEVRTARAKAGEGNEKAIGPDHSDTLSSVNNLGGLLNDKDDYEEAEKLFRRALERRKKALGSKHRYTLRSVNNLGNLLKDKGDYEGAEKLFRRALEGREKALGPEHPDTLDSVSGLGTLLIEKGDYEGAEEFYRRSVAGYKKALGSGHSDTLSSVNNLGILLRKKGDLEGAEKLFRQALEGNARQAAELSLEVIGAEDRLNQELREALDDASREGEWEEVMEIASAQESDEEGLLLAARGLARADESGGEETEKLVSLMLKWAERLGKPEWKEMVERMTATDSNEATVSQ